MTSHHDDQPDRQPDRLPDLRIPRLEAVSLALYVEAVRAKHERRRLLEPPAIEPEGDEDTTLYV